MSKELTPFELPEDYKFVYKIKGCENKFGFDINPIVEKILSTRAKKVDEEIIKQLKNIGEEYGINELILIDESKVLKMIKSLKALEIIKKKQVNVGDFIRCKSIEDYNDYCCYNEKEQLTQEEFDLMKEVLL